MNKELMISTADQTTSLAQWLRQIHPESMAVIEALTEAHLAKFLASIDSAEAENLLQFADDWYFKSDDWYSASNEKGTHGLPLLNALAEDPHGFPLVLALAKFQPRWVARWFCWKTAKSPERANNSLAQTILAALDVSPPDRTITGIPDETLMLIASYRPTLLATVSDEYLTQNITNILQTGLPNRHPIRTLIDANALPDAKSLFRSIVGDDQGKRALRELETFAKSWSNQFGLNPRSPLITAFANGLPELDPLLRLPWEKCANPNGRNQAWRDGFQPGSLRSFDDFPHDKLPDIVLEAIAAKPAAFALELGFSCGTRIAHEKWEVNIDTTRAALEQFCPHENADVGISTLPMATLWAILARLAEYEQNAWQHQLELTGLRAELNRFANANPTLWAQALPWLLPRMANLGQTVEAITYQLAVGNSDVWNALAKLTCHSDEAIRLKARGLQSFLQDSPDANSDFPRALADAAARYLDGTPMFPHPLTSLSATWLGSKDVETVIANGIARACSHFAQEVRDQGGDIEESLTKGLLKELEFAFRDSQPRIQLFGKHPPILTAKQRIPSKHTEESIYGCDLAWLINGNIKGRFDAVWVDLVQVKKSLALAQADKPSNNKTARADSWKIESEQLDTLLSWSQTATYWLIAAAGEVLVIPAKHLVGIRRGTNKVLPQKTFTVGYHEVRSVAIPLAQYLTELLIGQWLGTSTEAVLEFARGENTKCRPRTVIEVHVTGNHQDRK